MYRKSPSPTKRAKVALRIEALEGRAMPGDSFLSLLLGGTLLGPDFGPVGKTDLDAVSDYAVGHSSARETFSFSLPGDLARILTPSSAGPAPRGSQAPLPVNQQPDAGAPFSGGVGGVPFGGALKPDDVFASGARGNFFQISSSALSTHLAKGLYGNRESVSTLPPLMGTPLRAPLAVG
jgi:hypothetical protein